MLLLFYVDLLISATVCLLISKKRPRFADFTPFVVILAREATIIFFHVCYHHQLGIDVGEVDRSQYNGTLFILYVIIGMVGVSNFKIFLLMTTPVSVACMTLNLYLMAVWPTVSCECAS